MKRRARQGDSDRFNRIIDELSKPELQAFAANRLRFGACKETLHPETCWQRKPVAGYPTCRAVRG
ncbi:phage/plasmid replication protein, gene II/X family [Vibrio cholerae HC-7A1]|nr:phage/plasmid replication protein, gene II/X family [Vibrio cholerae HC-7A1]